MENLQSVSAIRRSCWLGELDHIMTPLTPLTPMAAARFGRGSNSCSYLDVTPPDSEYSSDDWSVFRDWSCHRKRCSRCQSPINPDEPTFTVMEAFYHKSCMVCAVCCKQITNGDSFGIDRNRVYCSAHFKAVEPVSRQFGGRETRNQSIEPSQERPRELRNWTENTYPALSSFVPRERREVQTSVRNTTCSRSCPSKRVRTSFTSDQIDMLNNFFETCRKPTTRQLEELSGVTGLKINVLRVWFQNARARLRRSFSDEMKENVDTWNVAQ